MLRLLRSRWMWPVLGALATTYLIRRSRQPEQASQRLFARDGGWRRSVTLGQVANVGKAALDTAMRALTRR